VCDEEDELALGKVITFGITPIFLPLGGDDRGGTESRDYQQSLFPPLFCFAFGTIGTTRV
jgi:hypothetical protein